ncbi:MAG: hypothetical protein AAGF23_08335 [Acidobacteriota bacterium]
MRFAVTTFQRVFDTVPNRDVVGLERLVRGLTTFVVKPKTEETVEREVARIEAAWRTLRDDGYAPGKYGSRLAQAGRRGESEGDSDAAQREFEHLVKEARSAPKRDLRLWSPTLYPEGAKRGGERVVHLSCLVLDYDSGVGIREATERFEEYFHIAHTTWSHTPRHPKFRVILPLAEPVHPADWRRVYDWAEARSGRAVDPTGKGVGTTFALPAVPAEDRTRAAYSRPGPLLDARLEGLLEHRAGPPPANVEPRGPNHFRIEIPGHRLVEGSFDGDDNRGAGGDAGDPWDAPFPWS